MKKLIRKIILIHLIAIYKRASNQFISKAKPNMATFTSEMVDNFEKQLKDLT